MQILHNISEQALAAVVGEQLANRIELARSGKLTVQMGAGGTYGKVKVNR